MSLPVISVNKMDHLQPVNIPKCLNNVPFFSSKDFTFKGIKDDFDAIGMTNLSRI